MSNTDAPTRGELIAAFSELVAQASDGDLAILWRILRALSAAPPPASRDGLGFSDYCKGEIIRGGFSK